MFISGIGKEKLFPKFLNKDFLLDKAAHFELANETASVVFAPKFVLFSVPSKSNKTLSIFFWLFASNPFNFDEIFNGVLIKKSNKKDVKKIEKLIDEEVEKDDGWKGFTGTLG